MKAIFEEVAMSNHPTITLSFVDSTRRVLRSFWDEMVSERIWR